MTLTKANSAKEPKINSAQPKNQISLALIYETFGKFLTSPPFSVTKAKIVDVPKVALGGPASACNQKVTQEVQTRRIEGRK